MFWQVSAVIPSNCCRCQKITSHEKLQLSANNYISRFSFTRKKNIENLILLCKNIIISKSGSKSGAILEDILFLRRNNNLVINDLELDDLSRKFFLSIKNQNVGLLNKIEIFFKIDIFVNNQNLLKNRNRQNIWI